LCVGSREIAAQTNASNSQGNYGHQKTNSHANEGRQQEGQEAGPQGLLIIMIEATQEALAPPGTIEIEDLNQFVQMLAGWHSQKVNTLEHMLEMPEGIEMAVTGEDPIVLTGDMLAGFKAGLELALMELGTLPFLYEVEPEVEAATADV
jgi:hypothetical protein